MGLRFLLAFLILFSVCVNVHSKGGGRGGGGGGRGGGGGGGFFFGGSSGGSGGGKGGPMKWWVKVFLVGIACVPFGQMLYKCFMCLNREESVTVPCYLCEERIKANIWDNGEHRIHCAAKEDHVILLNRLPSPIGVTCPTCGMRLKLWPGNIGYPTFSCGMQNCPSQGQQIRNNGRNRFNCFRHDFDICKHCAEVASRRQNPNVNRQGPWTIPVPEDPPPPYPGTPIASKYDKFASPQEIV